MLNKELNTKARKLSRYNDICETIKSKEMEIERYRDISTNISPHYSDMPRNSEAKNKIEEAIAEIDILSRQIAREIIKLKNTRNRIVKAIDELEDGRYRLVLINRYIDLKTWEKIAVDLNYDYSYVHKLHKQALRAIKMP